MPPVQSRPAPPITPAPIPSQGPIIPPRPSPLPKTYTGDWKAVLVVIAAILLVIIMANWGTNDRLGSTSTSTSTGTGAERVVTNYTTFNTVSFKNGAVETGWNFPSNRSTTPHNEYCYYRVPQEDGSRRVIDIEARPSLGRYDYPGEATLGLTRAEWDEAFTKCQWHPTSRPVVQNIVPPRAAPSPATRTPSVVSRSIESPPSRPAVPVPDGKSAIEQLSPAQRELLRGGG